MFSHHLSKRIDDALAQAMRHWQSRTAAARPAFTIAISRQAGADGPTIARTVGERLGWLVYDRELVEAIATEMGLRTQLVESIDEHQMSWVQQCLEAFGAQPGVSHVEYVRHLVEVLFALASHGECVIVGRGAAQILPEATTLRVRLGGPKPQRVKAIRERFDLSALDAERWVTETDQRRTGFVRDHFHRVPDDLAHYDVTLNTCRLGVGACAELIVTALEGLKGSREEAAVRQSREPLASART